MIEILINNQQTLLSFDQAPLKLAIECVLRDAGIRSGEVSLAVVDDATIHELNHRHLQHNYPTDVLSFLLDHYEDHLEGEIIVSAEMAIARANEFGWSAPEEMSLYVIHGSLHLVGYDDNTPEQRAEMDKKEKSYLTVLEARMGGQS